MLLLKDTSKCSFDLPLAMSSITRDTTHRLLTCLSAATYSSLRVQGWSTTNVPRFAAQEGEDRVAAAVNAGTNEQTINI